MNNIPTLTNSPEIFCSELSLEDGESMAGTAAIVDTWFLLEYTGTWTAKATNDNDLPGPVQVWLREQLNLVDNGRIQFIKQHRPKGFDSITFFVALSREAGSLLYQFRLNDYEELLSIDIPSLLSGAGIFDEFKHVDPLYLVCTNGKRDRCCSQVGLALYQALAEQVSDAVWQSTHLGGHRFAPTVVTLPDGTFYGRLAQHDLPSFVRTQALGEIDLGHLRGRCCYDGVTQAAEQFLRQKTGLRERSGYRLLDSLRQGELNWLVRFNEPAVRKIHQVNLSREMTNDERVVSCSPIKAKPVAQFRFISHELIEE